MEGNGCSSLVFGSRKFFSSGILAKNMKKKS
jgi:hypothetical protein